MKIQPLLFITPKSDYNNFSKQNKKQFPREDKLYNPAFYQDYNINFGARLFRTPANFYAQPFNQSGMPQTMKAYLEDDYDDRKNIPPSQMMKIVFEPIKYADNLEEVKVLFPDEPLFENLSSTPKRKARTGVIAEIELMQDENTKLFKNNDDSLGLYLLKKVYLEGKSLKEINKDFKEDISQDFNGISPVDYSTLNAYGIKMPNLAFWKSFLATREDFPYEYKPRKAYKLTENITRQKHETKELSIESLQNQASQKQVKGKFNDVKDWEIDKLADAIISGKGNEEETRKILKRKNIKNTESSNFVMKYMWAIMPIVLEKTNASVEMRSFWATHDTKNKSPKQIMDAYWNTTQLQGLQSLMMKDTIKLFMEAYGVDGNNEEFQQLLKYPAEIAERRKQFDKAHEQKQKEYDEMFAELDRLERQKAAENNAVEKISEKTPDKVSETAEIKIDNATGDVTISENLSKRFDEKIANDLYILPSQYKNKYLNFLKKHPLATDEFKLVSLFGNDSLLVKLVPDLLTEESVEGIYTIIDNDFTQAEPVLFNNLKQAFIDVISLADIQKPQNLYWEDSFNNIHNTSKSLAQKGNGRDAFKTLLNSRYECYRQPLSNSETQKITNVFIQLLTSTKPEDISTKNKFMSESFMVVVDAINNNPQMRKQLKQYMQKNSIIEHHGGNMRVLLDKNIDDKIKKEKVINLFATDEQLSTYITNSIINLAISDPKLYLKLKMLQDDFRSLN